MGAYVSSSRSFITGLDVTAADLAQFRTDLMADVAAAPFAAQGAVALRTFAARAADVFRLVDYVAVGDTDDTNAFNAMLAAWSASASGGTLVFPTNRITHLSAGSTIAMTQGQSLIVQGEGGGQARIQLASTFSGTVFAINEGASASYAQGEIVSFSNIQFISTTNATAGTCITCTGAGGGNSAPRPSFLAENITLNNLGTGGWALGIKLYAMIYTRVDGFKQQGVVATGAIGLWYDTDARISVGHEINSVYMDGNGVSGTVGVKIGTAGGTGPLQGFIMTKNSFLSDRGIDWEAADNGNQGSLYINASQFNCSGYGIYLSGVAEVNVTNTQFLSNLNAFYAYGGQRYLIHGNTFYIGQAINLATGNTAVVLDSIAYSPAGGSVVTNNLMTANAAGTDGVVKPLVTTLGTTNSVAVTSNLCLQGQALNNTRGLATPNNIDFGNFTSGGVSQIQLGGGAYSTFLNSTSGGFTMSPPSGGITRIGSQTNIVGQLQLGNQGAATTATLGFNSSGNPTDDAQVQCTGGVPGTQNMGNLSLDAANIAIACTGLSFYGHGGFEGQQTVGGSRGGNAALAALITALANVGLIIDGTTT